MAKDKAPLPGKPEEAMNERHASISRAFGRLRTNVLVCCGVILIALVAHVVIWALASFTDMRYKESVNDEAVPIVVMEAAESPELLMSLNDEEVITTEDEEVPGINESGTRTAIDFILEDTMTLTSAAGTLALCIMLPLICLGVLLIGTSGLPGVERTISALIWGIILAALTLPLGTVFELPWQNGVFSPYAGMVEEIEATRADYGGAGADLMYYARHLVVPFACVIGVLILGWRFAVGVEQGLPSEYQHLDPVLEVEAQRVAQSATSLHANRSDKVFTGAMEASAPPKVEAPPRRLI